MVSDFLKKKLLHVFNSFFDTDKNGHIEKSDINSLAEKALKYKGVSSNDAKGKEIQDALNKIFQGILGTVDTDNDGRISADEWVTLFIDGKFYDTEWNKLHMKTVFDLIDAGGDGNITSEEFTNFFAYFGLNKGEAAEAFKKLSVPTLTFGDFQKFWKQYFSSEDQSAPGTFLIGKTTF